MNEKTVTIEIRGKQYELFFSTEAYLKVCEKYGGLKELSDKIQDMTPAQLTIEGAYLAALLINQKIQIDNEEKGTNEPFITEQAILRHLTPAEQTKARSKVFEAINLGMTGEIKNTDNDADSDGEDVVLAEINKGKNVEGAAAEK
jgi:hypothetical protein